MNWISYSQHRPNLSQPYLISVERPYNDATLTFNTMAYYNAETHQWFKYDGFDDNSTKDLITDRVVGWIDGMTTFL